MIIACKTVTTGTDNTFVGNDQTDLSVNTGSNNTYINPEQELVLVVIIIPLLVVITNNQNSLDIHPKRFCRVI